MAFRKRIGTTFLNEFIAREGAGLALQLCLER